MDDRITRRRFLAGSAVTATASVSGCTVAGSERDVTETVTNTYDLDGASRLTVSVSIGEVQVQQADRESVRVRGTKAAAGESDLESLELVSERTDDTLELRVENEESVFRLGPQPKMDLDIVVPEGVDTLGLDVTSDGVTVDGVDAEIAVDGTNGDISLTDVDAATVDTTNGDVTVDGADGDVRADLTNGDVELRGVTGDIDVETTNGEIDIYTEAELDATVEFETTNGDIRVETAEGVQRSEGSYSGTFGDGSRRISAGSTNGDITLSVGS